MVKNLAIGEQLFVYSNLCLVPKVYRLSIFLSICVAILYEQRKGLKSDRAKGVYLGFMGKVVDGVKLCSLNSLEYQQLSIIQSEIHRLKDNYSQSLSYLE